METLRREDLDSDFWEALVEARKAAGSAYAPYSSFAVGACLVTEEGDLIPGCNVENASYSLTVCAERAALCAAVCKGYRAFRALVLYVDRPSPVSPCGACRQSLFEFAPDLVLFLACRGDMVRRVLLSDLLPLAFGQDALPPSPVDREEA